MSFNKQNCPTDQPDDDESDLLKERLQIKSESLLLLSQQLENSNKEKDEYKRLIDTLYDKNVTLKKKLYDENDKKISTTTKQNKNQKDLLENSDIDSEEYMKILKDLVNTLKKDKTDLQQKYEDAKQELNDCKIDIKLLREQIARQRVGSSNEGLTVKLETNVDRENLIKEIELLREKNQTIENDLKMIICQKEEFELERDSYMTKFKQLNDFLLESSRINNSTNHVSLSIDELISQNKYLNDTNKGLKEEVALLKDQISKFKRCVNSNSSNNNTTATSPYKTSTSSQIHSNLDSTSVLENTGVLNKSQIKVLLKQSDDFVKSFTKQQSSNSSSSNVFSSTTALLLIKDLGLVCESLLDCLSDKNVALQHQKKVNKMLANRILDLERELDGYLNSSKQAEFNSELIQFDNDKDSDHTSEQSAKNDEERLCELMADLTRKFKAHSRTTAGTEDLNTSKHENGANHDSNENENDKKKIKHIENDCLTTNA